MQQLTERKQYVVSKNKVTPLFYRTIKYQNLYNKLSNRKDNTYAKNHSR